jgi:hypothetical protein
VTVLGSGEPFVKKSQASASLLIEVGNAEGAAARGLAPGGTIVLVAAAVFALASIITGSRAALR